MIYVLVLVVALLNARAAMASLCEGDRLIGGGGDDTIIGSSCDDVIVGNDGDNILTGLRGHDLFAFSTGYCRGLEWQAGWAQLVAPSSGDCFVPPFPFFPSFGISEITDFTRGFDRIGLDKATFTALQSEIGLGLGDPTDFQAVDSDAAVEVDPAVIVYSVESGMLFYNENGPAAGLGQGGPFAELSGVALFEPLDFQVLDWTTLPPECPVGNDCDDNNVCTDDVCAAGTCINTPNGASCDDGDICTAGDTCNGGVCVPGVPLEAAVLVSFVTDATAAPASCSGKKDKRRAKKITKQMKAAKRKLEKAARAKTEKRRQRHLKKADAKVRKAHILADRFAGKLSPECHAEIAQIVTEVQARANCLR